MALERHGHLGGRDAAPVVGDADQLDAAALHLNGDRRRARVECVLQQLFHRGRRPLNDLAHRDARRDLGREETDGHGASANGREEVGGPFGGIAGRARCLSPRSP